MGGLFPGIGKAKGKMTSRSVAMKMREQMAANGCTYVILTR